MRSGGKLTNSQVALAFKLRSLASIDLVYRDASGSRIALAYDLGSIDPDIRVFISITCLLFLAGGSLPRRLSSIAVRRAKMRSSSEEDDSESDSCVMCCFMHWDGPYDSSSEIGRADAQ